MWLENDYNTCLIFSFFLGPTLLLNSDNIKQRLGSAALDRSVDTAVIFLSSKKYHQHLSLPANLLVLQCRSVAFVLSLKGGLVFVLDFLSFHFVCLP